MKVVFYAAARPIDTAISRAFCAGAKRHGADIEIAEHLPHAKSQPIRGDVAVICGVQGHRVFSRYRQRNRHAIIIDKGYTRIRGGELGTLYWRVSVDALQPVEYFQAVKHHADRWDKLQLAPLPWQPHEDGRVLFAGSSQDYCDWHGLGKAEDFALKTMRLLKQHTRREIVYRPKPSWGRAWPLRGFKFSPPKTKLFVELPTVFTLVTFGSNAAIEALLCGVPAVVLGDGLCRPLAGTSLKRIERPCIPPELDRLQFFYDMAYCQWTLEEMQSGLVWEHLRERLG
jgi:hypothetical protein